MTVPPAVTHALALGVGLALGTVSPVLAQRPAPQADTVAAGIVDRYIAAYNAHDARGMALWWPDTVLLGNIPAGPDDECRRTPKFPHP